MTIQSFPHGILLPQSPVDPDNIGLSAITIDAASEKAAFILQIPYTGTLTAVGFNVGTHTTGATLEVSVETVDAATGNPSGTQYVSSSIGTVASAAGWLECSINGGTGVSVTRGDVVAVVIAQPAVSAGNCTISTGAASRIFQAHFPYCAGYTTSWTKTLDAPNVVFKYGSDYYSPYGTMAVISTSSLTVSTSTTPDEVGNLFQVPFPVTVSGLWASVDSDGDTDLVLYDSSSSVLASVSRDKDVRGSGIGKNHYAMFSSDITLTKNTNYRVVIKPTSTTSMGARQLTATSSAVLGATMPGTTFYKTSRTDAGAWTDDSSSRILCGLIVNGFDDGAGGGGGLAANPIGGFVA